MKKWILNERPADTREMRAQFGDFLGELLSCKGIHSLEAAQERFVCNELSDPFTMRDMDRAVEIIQGAIDEGRKITVFGDYDCDGVTSTVMLVHYLDSMGAEVDYYIPERAEGYGLNMAAVKNIIEGGTELIVTVDNGISAFEEAEYIRSQGVQLVITDHHQPQEDIPACDACVNPHRTDDRSDFKNLCGAGVALKLMCALEEDEELILEQYSDLAAIGTVGDVMPLVGENRFIVRRGLENIRNRQNLGIEKLLGCARVSEDKINSATIAFQICPRINAAGRVGSPKTAVRLLLSETPESAQLLAEQLEQYNTERKSIEADIVKQAEAQIKQNPVIGKQRIIIVSGENWSHGVVGLVCTRLLEKYGRPVFAIGIENGEGRGSARGIEGFNVFRLLDACSEILTKYGGHPRAGGFSLPADKIGEFAEMAYEYCRKTYPKMPNSTLEADMLADGGVLTVENVSEIAKLEPFGEGNKMPQFMLKNWKIRSKRSLKEGKYTSFEIEQGSDVFKCITFSVPYAEFFPAVGDSVDLIVNAEINEYNGDTSVNLRLIGIRPADFSEDRFFAAERVYEEISRGEGCDSRLAPRVIPDREAMKVIFDLIRKNGRFMNAEDMCVYGGMNINYCMLRIGMDALSEAEMIEIKPDGRTELLPVTAKRDLFGEGLIARLKSQLMTAAVV